MLRSEGVEVDDEDVDPENITPPTPATGRWELPRTCPRKGDQNITNLEGRWKAKSWNTVKEMALLSVFRMCMPEQYIKDVVLKETNKHLEETLTLSEFYKWLGCRFYMACYVGISPINLWWSKEEAGMFKGAPFRLDHIMSLNRFQAIDKAIQYTDKLAPEDFVDKFHDVRQLVDAFNDHMSDAYTPSWLSCLDERMNTWLNKSVLPRLRGGPQETPHFGNGYHSIADDQGLSNHVEDAVARGQGPTQTGTCEWSVGAPVEIRDGVEDCSADARDNRAHPRFGQDCIDGLWFLRDCRHLSIA